MHSNSTCVYEYAVVSWIHGYLYPIVFSTLTTSSSFSRKIGVWQRSLTVDSICDVYCRRCKCLCIYNYAYGWNVCNMCKCVCHSYRTNNNNNKNSLFFILFDDNRQMRNSNNKSDSITFKSEFYHLNFHTKKWNRIKCDYDVWVRLLCFVADTT